MNEQSAPVRVGETFDVAINSIGGKGDGIAKVKGFVLFVANTQKGDYVKVRVTKVLPTVGFAEVVEKLEKPVKESKYATVTQEEFTGTEEISEKYEDTDDFGSDLKEE